MKKVLQIVFVFLSFSAFSQTTKEALKQISIGDTIIFTAQSTGCFNAGTNTYKFLKVKNKERKVLCAIDRVKSTKKISVKNYDAFLKRFEDSKERFKDPDEKQLCTTIQDFEISNKKRSLTFTNGSCLPDFDPEAFLIKLLK